MRPITPDHQSLAPPPEPGQGRAVGLSLLAHAALGLALAWGVRWTSSTPQVAFSAEIWSPTVQEAAPAAAEPPPPPPPPPAAEKRPAPPPPSKASAAREPEPSKADIALEKKRKQEEDRKKAEAEKEKAKAKAEQDKAEKAKAAKEKAEQAKADKEKAEKEKAEKEKLAKEKARKEEEERKQKAQMEREKAQEQAREEAAAQEKLRQEQLQRIKGMAGATGAPEARGNAPRSTAPSASYAGKIIRLVKDNVSYAGSASGNPTVVVLVKAGPSGTILSRKVVSPSGNKEYDEAVLRAVDKMGSVPKDVDGRIPEVLLQEGLEIKVTL